MSLFPRFVSHNHEFSPLFRLLDDFATISRSNLPASSNIRAFTPKFDVRELKDSYELHGELPGIEQKDVEIQWEDSQTLSIKGRVEHRSERGQRPAGYVTETAASEDKSGEQAQEQHDYHKPTVEDDGTEANTSTEVAKTNNNAANQQLQKQDETQSTGRYWVTERSVGEFHRSFSFPARVDQEAVKASLKNGILSIIVPKAQAQKPRRINIE